MATIVTRSSKGSALTHNEIDANFTNLNDDFTNLNDDFTNLNDDKAEKSNVLTKDNTTPFTPDSDYEPATKKYVDDNIGQAKNLIVNGDKRVNQRDYADGVLANGAYGYDRWKGADNDANIEQIIEQQNITSGTYTITFTGGGTSTVAGTSGLASGANVVITVSGDISVKVPKGASNIQLEKGTVATPFELRSYGLELSLCQRYYEVIEISNGNRFSIGYEDEGTVKYPIRFDVKKRIIPSIGTGSGSWVSNLKYQRNGSSFTSFSSFNSIGSISLNCFHLTMNKPSTTGGNNVLVASPAETITVDAEL